MTCQEFETLFFDEKRDYVTASEIKATVRHLHGCEACQGKLMRLPKPVDMDAVRRGREDVLEVFCSDDPELS